MQKKKSTKQLAAVNHGYDSASDADTIAYQALKLKKNNHNSDDEGYETDTYQDI